MRLIGGLSLVGLAAAIGLTSVLWMRVASAQAVPETHRLIGYTELRRELGAATPDGAGVVVDLVEPANRPPTLTEIEAATGDRARLVFAFLPDLFGRRFGGVRFHVVSPLPDSDNVELAASPHATETVGRWLFGSDTVAPGIDRVNCFVVYNATRLPGDWLGGGFLRAGQPAPPRLAPPRGGAPARIVHCSWGWRYFGYPETLVQDALLRMDYAAAADQRVQVVSVENGPGENTRPLLAAAYNAIAVGRLDGQHRIGPGFLHPTDPDQPSPYAAPRTRPDLVAPGETTGSAAAVVSSAAAMLVQAARHHPSRSTGSVTTRAGDTVLHAETPEVIKAALMAGADRRAINTHAQQDDPEQRYGHEPTPNGLDPRYGAGLLNVLHTHHILATPQTHSRHNGNGRIDATHGWDYDPAFAPPPSVNAAATYAFTANEQQRELFATLVWHLDVDIQHVIEDPEHPRAAHLPNLDLVLYDVTVGVAYPVARSRSMHDNTETIAAGLVPGRRYELRVLRRNTGHDESEIDYALAWRTSSRDPMHPPVLPGDANHDGRVTAADFTAVQVNFGNTTDSNQPLPGDADGNQRVTAADFTAVQINFGSTIDNN